MAENHNNAFTRRMFIKGVATSFGALPVFAWPRWAQAFYYNLGFFKKGADPVTYVEDVFSTYIYTGNGGAQTITNGIDLAGNGGLVWMKSRNITYIHELYDTVRGVNMHMHSDENGPSVSTAPNGITSFNANGFTTGSYTYHNGNSTAFASWTFRKAKKFFDIVTFTGDGSSTQSVAHNLGITPGVVLIKRTDSSGHWVFRSGSNALKLNSSDAHNSTFPGAVSWNATTFTTSNNWDSADALLKCNVSGASYVAYLFANNTDADGMIRCGTYTGNNTYTGPTVTLGWEPQWIMIKRTDAAEDWTIIDNVRGMAHVAGGTGTNTTELFPDLTNAENNDPSSFALMPTGFQVRSINTRHNANGSTYLYVAIRRGPMKVPTSGTQVYQPVLQNGTAVNPRVLTGVAFPADLMIMSDRSTTGAKHIFYDRLRGANSSVATYGNWDENDMFGGSDGVTLTQDGVKIASAGTALNGGVSFIHHFFRRAPGFFDMVCYTGDGVSDRQVDHGLTVAPELILIKCRSNARNWIVHTKELIQSGKFLWANSSDAAALNSTQGYSNSLVPTSTKFTAETTNNNVTGNTYVAYLFASCAGVSKIGTFTGAATDVTVSCGFSGQPRFVLVKRTDTTGDWIMVDSARGTSVYLTLNNLNAETSAIVITFTTGGFVAKAGTVANAASGASYIFMAIA